MHHHVWGNCSPSRHEVHHAAQGGITVNSCQLLEQLQALRYMVINVPPKEGIELYTSKVYATECFRGYCKSTKFRDRFNFAVAYQLNRII